MAERDIFWPGNKRALVAILRGIRPSEVAAMTEMLIDEGITSIEVPLNSPDPFQSIETAIAIAGDRALIGAGTVLTVEDVDRLSDIGGQLVVSPNTDPDVIRRSVALGMVSMPGVFTPSEALLAHKSGASALKFFPASALGVSGISASRQFCRKKHLSALLAVFPMLRSATISRSVCAPSVLGRAYTGLVMHSTLFASGLARPSKPMIAPPQTELH